MAGPTHDAPAVRLFIPKFGRVVLIDPTHPLALAAGAASALPPVSADPLTENAAPRATASAATEREAPDTAPLAPQAPQAQQAPAPRTRNRARSSAAAREATT